MEIDFTSKIIAIVGRSHVEEMLSKNLASKYSLFNINERELLCEIPKKNEMLSAVTKYATIIFVCLPSKSSIHLLEIIETIFKNDKLENHQKPLIVNIHTSENELEIPLTIKRMYPSVVNITLVGLYVSLEKKTQLLFITESCIQQEQVILTEIFTDIGGVLMDDISSNNKLNEYVNENDKMLGSFQDAHSKYVCMKENELNTVKCNCVNVFIECEMADDSPKVNLNITPELSESKQHYSLTAKQTEVLRWVKSGKTNAEVSIIMSISNNTVKYHLKNIYEKLGVFNRVQAAQTELDLS